MRTVSTNEKAGGEPENGALANVKSRGERSGFCSGWNRRLWSVSIENWEKPSVVQDIWPYLYVLYFESHSSRTDGGFIFGGSSESKREDRRLVNCIRTMPQIFARRIRNFLSLSICGNNLRWRGIIYVRWNGFLICLTRHIELESSKDAFARRRRF